MKVFEESRIVNLPKPQGLEKMDRGVTKKSSKVDFRARVAIPLSNERMSEMQKRFRAMSLDLEIEHAKTNEVQKLADEILTNLTLEKDQR